MALVSLKTCEELAQLAQAAREGQIGPEQAEFLSGQRLEWGMIRLQFLVTLHQILDDKVQKETQQGSEVQSSGDPLVVPLPDSSPDVSQEIVKYLELTPVQIAAIQAQIEKERGQVRPLVKRLARNRRALKRPRSKDVSMLVGCATSRPNSRESRSSSLSPMRACRQGSTKSLRLRNNEKSMK